MTQPGDPVRFEIPLTEDCRQLFARAAELSTGDAIITRDLILRAFWELDVPGSRLLSRVGLTPAALGAELKPDEDEWALAHLLADASSTAWDQDLPCLFDSLHMAEQVIRHPWAGLVAHMKAHPITDGDLAALIDELRSSAGILPSVLHAIGKPWPGRPAVGRDRELERLQGILIRSRQRGAFIVGPPGCGKTALVDGLSFLLQGESAPAALRGTPVVQLDPEKLIALLKDSGPAALRDAIEAGSKTGAVLVLDDLEEWIQQGDVLTSLLHAAAVEHRARLLIVGSPEVQGRLTSALPSLTDELDTLVIVPAEPETCGAILAGLCPGMRETYGLPIGDEALKAIPHLATRYLGDLGSPASSIRLLDDSFARAALHGEAEVTLDQVCDVVEARTGVPVRGIGARERETLSNLDQELARRVIGQADAIAAVARTIRRSRAGLGDPNRPIGSFLFLGPSGVGKTELARATAEVVFGSAGDLLAFDMSEYKMEEDVWGLVGAARGFKQAEMGGTLTEPVRRKPYSLVLFDEMEKADPQVLDILLQILEEGRLTDGIGRKVDFRNTLIIMTSNLASDVVRHPGGEIGFVQHQGQDGGQAGALSEEIDRELRSVLRPELINRIDRVVPFKALQLDQLKTIAGLQLRALEQRVSDRGVSIEATAEALDWLATKGYEPRYGARPLRRVIQEHVADPLVDILLGGNAESPGTVRLGVVGDELRLEVLAGTARPGSSARPASV